MSRYECERSWRVNALLTHVAQMKAFVSHAESTFAAGVDIMVNNGACVAFHTLVAYIDGPSVVLVLCTAGVMYFTLMKNLLVCRLARWQWLYCKPYTHCARRKMTGSAFVSRGGAAALLRLRPATHSTVVWCLFGGQTVDVNCKGTLNGIAAVLPGMLERKAGHIVNISSDAGRKVWTVLGSPNQHPGFAIDSCTCPALASGVSRAIRVLSVQVLRGGCVTGAAKVGCGNALPRAHSVCFRQGLRLETVGSGVKVTTVQVLEIHST